MVDWKVRAAAARKKLKAAKRGEKDDALLLLADGKDVNTLRREVFALDFLDEIEKTNPSLRKQLNGVPFSIVELLARWRSFDRSGALKAAREAARGQYTVARLSKAISDARRTGGADFEPAYRDMIADAALDAIRDAIGGDVFLDETSGKDSIDRSIDFKYRRMIGSTPRFETVAAIVVGPYKDSALYRKRRRDWLYRAFGLAWFYNHVVILLPLRSELDDYRSGVAEAKKRIRSQNKETAAKDVPRGEPDVHVLHPDPWRHSKLTDEQVEALSKA